MTSANQAQIDFWNGDGGRRWTARQTWLDSIVAPFGDAAMAVAQPAAGETVIDVGCGCGDTTIALARAVGPSGAVLGVDVSAPMLARARERCGGLANVTLLEADAAAATLPTGRDLLYSRFGVMFFADPPAAFAAMRRALKPGGRLAFVCWRPFVENPWALVPAMAGFKALGVTPPPADPHVPGPFALADKSRVQTILRDAGFVDERAEPFESAMRLGASVAEAAAMSAEVGPLAGLLRETGADPGPVVAAVAEALAPYVEADAVSLPGRVWIVSAKSP